MERLHPAELSRRGFSGAARTFGLLLMLVAGLLGGTDGAAPPGNSRGTQPGSNPAQGGPSAAQPGKSSPPGSAVQPQQGDAAQPGIVANPSNRGESAQDHQAALQAEKQFAQEIMQRFNVRMSLIETPHFVIWTTLPAEQHKVLSSQCEAMYAALLKIFQLPADQPVFLGKCGVFVLSNQEQFKGFCQYVQQIPPDRTQHAVGFQVALPDGRSRIIAFWPGNLQELAETLVHEGSHAFLQRYRNDTHVITWFNEGLAEHVVGLVFRAQCAEGREAMQAAMDVARNDPQTLTKLLAMDGALPGEYYPVAQSVVAFLVQKNGQAFVQMIQGLKNTEPFAQILRKTYKASVPELDTHWRAWLQQTAQSGKAVY